MHRAIVEQHNKNRMENKLVLDTCCGSRMFWFDRQNPNVAFADIRDENHTLCDGRALNVNPDVISDFTQMIFEDESFYHVVFDPPHMNKLGASSWMAKKYGRLLPSWKDDITEGFHECMRVLKPYGTLTFKWNESQITSKQILELIPYKPLYGHTTGRQAKTIWMVFMKIPN